MSPELVAFREDMAHSYRVLEQPRLRGISRFTLRVPSPTSPLASLGSRVTLSG